ncbi:type II secretion system protein [Sulfurospirillum cavolei]|uniref:type II secretion system protein n=1 Tax=Sulfurospirillum cavolei TaxID=366522 RepID=UPI00076484D5|nr:prepilin-type N-terminal cleavage/methylation domain-containing protein [Sulfurospirillum cavolei]
MRKGFTMIELIFVIVILGILAAVAIPRLTATRDDATASKLAANLSTLVSDAGSYYTAKGNTSWNAAKATDVTNVELQTAANAMTAATDATTFVGTTLYLNADATHSCFTITTTSDGNMTVATGAQTTGACEGAQTTAANLIKTYSFGGTGITR